MRGRRWSTDEDNELICHWLYGSSVDLISAQLGRSRKGVYTRVKKLRDAGELPAPETRYGDGSGVAPCASCQYRFIQSTSWHRYCSRACVNAAHRVPKEQWQIDGLCPKCKQHPKATRPNGKTRSWCRQCESKQKAEYLRTEAGKETMRRYQRSEKGRAKLREKARKQYHKNKAAHDA